MSDILFAMLSVFPFIRLHSLHLQSSYVTKDLHHQELNKQIFHIWIHLLIFCKVSEDKTEIEKY